MCRRAGGTSAATRFTNSTPLHSSSRENPAPPCPPFLVRYRTRSTFWAQNWGWYDPARGTQTYAAALEDMRAYLRSHADRARALGKPLVIEEFGLARDSGTYDPAAGTSVRDDYYSAVFAEAYRLAAAGAPVAGVDFWAWAGEGRAPRPGAPWKAGDAWIGDPPHEYQGWYSVYDADVRTAAVIARWARRFSMIGKGAPEAGGFNSR
jgi:mannan endo-1,4-beta-mannosidase